eukprot:322585_1
MTALRFPILLSVLLCNCAGIYGDHSPELQELADIVPGAGSTGNLTIGKFIRPSREVVDIRDHIQSFADKHWFSKLASHNFPINVLDMEKSTTREIKPVNFKYD